MLGTDAAFARVLVAAMVVVVSFLQPHHPRLIQLVESETELLELGLVSGGVVTMVEIGEFVVMVVVRMTVLVLAFLQPNQPGVRHVVLTVVVVRVVVMGVDIVVVVDSSRQPHHPGVLQVLVLRRLVDVVLLRRVVVVVSEPLLSKYFQLKQSTHSVFGEHFGTFS